ncbi:hypothetical protein B566_EDAN004025 [Ephemera danica]|nr:hypothetical protein B566_EDAN004025 [Ephemera danica]
MDHELMEMEGEMDMDNLDKATFEQEMKRLREEMAELQEGEQRDVPKKKGAEEERAELFTSLGLDVDNIGQFTSNFRSSIICSPFSNPALIRDRKWNSIAKALTFPSIPQAVIKSFKLEKLSVDDECPGQGRNGTSKPLNLVAEIPEIGVQNLHTLKQLKEETKNDNTQGHSGVFRDSVWQTSRKQEAVDLGPLEDVVIKIRIFKPFPMEHSNGRQKSPPKPQQEVLVLGSQTLDVYKSGFFFIEDTFYNDMRHPDSKDLSQVVRTWADNNPKCNFGGTKTATMEHTKFCDLTVRLGYPYVYQHLGNCEHVLVFVNYHLITSQDNLCSKVYPMFRTPNKKDTIMCFTCGFFKANWITYNNLRVPHDPAYFCEPCYIAYNYKDGKKIGEFTSHPFSEDNTLHLLSSAALQSAEQKRQESRARRVEKVMQEIGEMVMPPPLFAPPRLPNAYPAVLMPQKPKNSTAASAAGP